MKEWTDDIENILVKIRLNALIRSKYHKASYFRMLSLLKYFRIPVILLSGLSSVFSVALQNLMQQYIISLLCCFISLTVGLIGSVEMFLQIQKQTEIDLHSAKGFHLVSSNITKMISIKPENRPIDGHAFLDEIFNEYNSLIETSVITDKTLHDKLLGLDLIEMPLSESQNIKMFMNEIDIAAIIKPLNTPPVMSPRSSMLRMFRNESFSSV